MVSSEYSMNSRLPTELLPAFVVITTIESDFSTQPTVHSCLNGVLWVISPSV